MTARSVAMATLVVLGILLLAYLLAQVLHVLLIVFLGILVASAIEPLVNRLRRGSVSRGQGVLVTYSVIAALVALLALLIVPPMMGQVSDFVEHVPALLDTVQGQIDANAPRALREPASRAVASARAYGAAANGAPAPTADGAAAAAVEPQQVVDAGLTIANLLVAIVSIFVIGYYWLIERAALKRTVLQLAGPNHAKRVNLLWTAVEVRLGAWVRGQLFLMAVVGIGLGTSYLALGIPGALPLALWAALAEMIPMVGPYLGVAPALLVALTVSPTTALLLLGVAIVIQSIEGYVLVPKVMGRAVGVSPLIVFVGILIGEQLGGLAGAFLAVPVAGSLQVILEDLFSPTQEVAVRAQEAGASGQTVQQAAAGRAALSDELERSRPTPIPPHAHPVLPGGRVAAEAEAKTVGTTTPTEETATRG
jgi:predicted PurR-regulated permease PerM